MGHVNLQPGSGKALEGAGRGGEIDDGSWQLERTTISAYLHNGLENLQARLMLLVRAGISLERGRFWAMEKRLESWCWHSAMFH